jgi:hypothetical protein
MRGHFIVVDSVDGDILRVFDGNGRRGNVTRGEFLDRWDGHVLQVSRCNAASRSQAGHQTAPVVSLPTLYTDKGELPQGTENTLFQIPIRNAGQADLLVNDVISSCVCTVTEKPNEPIPPGDAATITIQCATSGIVGPFEQSVYIHTNDPVTPIVAMSLAGYVAHEVDVSHRVVHFGDNWRRIRR